MVCVMASVQTQPATAVVGQQPLPISVSVITLNEEQNLARCLESVRGLASEIVVLDSGSVDRTGEIARDFGANFEAHPWQGHVAQKNAALRQCTQPWVLCLDADEALSPELARSIRQLFATGQPNAERVLGEPPNVLSWRLDPSRVVPRVAVASGPTRPCGMARRRRARTAGGAGRNQADLGRPVALPAVS